MNGKFSKFLIFGLIALLLSSPLASGLFLVSNQSEKLEDHWTNSDFSLEEAPKTNCDIESNIIPVNGRNSRDLVVGPLELLNNTDFSVNSDWVFVRVYNASFPVGHTIVDYDNAITPTEANIINDEIIEVQETPFKFKSRVNQTFWKPCWTSNTSNSVVLTFDYMFSGDVILNLDFNPVIDGDILVELKNKKTGVWAVWPLEYGSGSTKWGNGSYNTDDTRRNIWQYIIEDISSGTSFFNGPNVTDVFDITAPGYYEISIIFQITTVITATVDVTTQFKLVIDNVSLKVSDNLLPDIESPEDKYVFGPLNEFTYNNESTGYINIDFHAGSNKNTPLDEAKFRRVIGPGPWYQIFKVTRARDYEKNWSIAEDWSNFSEGGNILDIYCSDQVGNYRDLFRINVIKDTLKPITNATPLQKTYKKSAIDIHYTATDPGLAANTSGGYNNTVKLFFKYNGQGDFVNYTPSWNPSGLFNESPIRFSIVEAGVQYGEGNYEFYTIGIDNATNMETAPLIPDAKTIIDYNLPESSVSPLDPITPARDFEIQFQANDSGSGINYTELYYLLNDEWLKWNGTTENGIFRESPIQFSAESDAEYGFITVAYDNASNIELNGIPTGTTVPDTITIVDSQAPSPKFIKPIKKHLMGTETITVISDLDTEYVEFYYWVDSDADGKADEDDLNSSWVLIYNLSREIGKEPPVNWSTEWDTLYYNELKNSENMVVLKAIGADQTDKKGNGTKNNIEVDNKAPSVSITNPMDSTAENGLTIKINYTADNDANKSNFYYKITGKDLDWTLIEKNVPHLYGTATGSYTWVLAQSLRIQSPEVDVKVEVIDDAGNIGEDTVTFYVNRQGPKIRANFPSSIVWDEDFGKETQKVTDYESHSNNEFSGDNLKWYITGNSGTIFQVTGDNSTGVDADTFIFTSIPNKFGTEVLTYNLYDPQNLKATIFQTIIILPINDKPKVSLPTDTIHIAVKEDSFDTTEFISDVDHSKSELSLIVNEDYVTPSGLNLSFSFPENMKGTEKIIQVKVNDTIDETTGSLKILITDNHRPQWIKSFPTDLELQYGEPKTNYLKLNDYFTDPDGDNLSFTYESDEVDITLNNNNEISLEAKPNIEGRYRITFIATDPHGGFAYGYMWVTLIDEPDPPRIRDIPDLNIHYYSDTIADYKGYAYDFSYFITDPDTELKDITIWVVTVLEDDDENWIEIDKNNKLKLIFKFPFSAAGIKHPLYLYADDPHPKTDPVPQLFNVTIIVDNWPVEQINDIPDQSFLEDGEKENAIKISDYFYDRDGGTNYNIKSTQSSNIKAEINQNPDDNEFYVDLSYKRANWFGDELVTIIAIDTQPEQYVYAVFNVKVISDPDPPRFTKALPRINVTKGEQTTLDLAAFIDDVDTDDSVLKITTNAPDDKVWASNLLLIIQYDEVGQKTVDITVSDEDGKSTTATLTIDVIAPAKGGTEEVIPNWLMWVAVIIIILVVVLIVFVVMLSSHYKVHEVFLIHQSGILLKHLSSDDTHGRDDEIVSGMFTAVQEFIKESFSPSGRAGRTGTDEDYVLQEMKIGRNNNILIERGKYVYLAVIFSGRGSTKLRRDAKGILNSIETKYEMPFKTWVGDMDKIAGVDRLLQPLFPSGGKSVMLTDKHLGRVAPPEPSRGPPSPGTPTAGPIAPVTPAPVRPVTPVSPKPVSPVTPVAPRPAAPAVKPAPVKPVMPKPAPAQALTPAPKPAPAAVSPKPVAPAPKPAAAAVAPKPAVPATAAAPKPAPATGMPKCPKCGGIVNKFPDGSMLCPKCGYTGS